MNESNLKRLSLSVDEYALGYSLMGQAQMGQYVLTSAYAGMTGVQLEERLTSASHSLLARELVEIRDNDTVIPSEELTEIYFPLLKYTALIQVILTGADGLPAVANVQVGIRGTFTATRIDQGVITRLWSGALNQFPALINEWVRFETRLTPAVESALEGRQVTISLQTMAEVQELSEKAAAKLLSADGLSGPLLSALAKDLTHPAGRGSIVRMDATPETAYDVNPDEAGRGLIFLLGARDNWLFKFAQVNDQALGRILPGKTDLFLQELLGIIHN